MIVAGKYELLELLQELGIRTYRARQLKLGQQVMVHFIPGTEREDDYALLEQLAQLPDSERKLFFDAGEHESVPYVVSWPLPDFRSLPEWLERTLGKDRAPSAPPTLAPKTTRGDPSEFSRLFFSGLKEPAATPAAPGEFTRMFQGPVPAQSPAPASPKNTPGEFTALFQGASTPTAPPTPMGNDSAALRAAQPAAQAGEFTSFFQPDLASKRPASVGPARLEMPPAKPGSRRVESNLDDLFDLPPAPPPAAPSGEVTELLREVPNPPPVSPRTPSPGDYTMVIGGGGRPENSSPQVAPPVAPISPAADKPGASTFRPNYFPMWIGLGILLLLALGLVLFFALAH